MKRVSDAVRCFALPTSSRLLLPLLSLLVLILHILVPVVFLLGQSLLLVPQEAVQFAEECQGRHQTGALLVGFIQQEMVLVLIRPIVEELDQTGGRHQVPDRLRYFVNLTVTCDQSNLPLKFIHNVGHNVGLRQDVTSVNGGEQLGSSVAWLWLRFWLRVILLTHLSGLQVKTAGCTEQGERCEVSIENHNLQS